jgi:hypothetical protein
MITIPTTELTGCLTDVLPIVTDPKHSNYAGILIRWDGERLHFAAYDIYSGATVAWFPGEGAEGELDDDAESDDIHWGGDDDPWATFIPYEQAKEIVKLFKLPAKLWRFPVGIKCSPTGDRLIVEREDGPRVGRQLMIQADPDMVAKIPNIRNQAASGTICERDTAGFPNFRLAQFAGVRPHGVLVMVFKTSDDPVSIQLGNRFAGFIYQAGAKGVHPYSALRDGAGVVASGKSEWPS